LYQGTTLVVPYRRRMMALAPATPDGCAGAGAEAHVCLGFYGTTKVVP
jgi:hypothetical protein